MLLKCAVTLVVATATAVAQGTINYITFTSPVTPNTYYVAGKSATFSWINPCVAPSTRVSSTPSKTEVQLVDATNPSSTFFLETAGYIDCSIATQGNAAWVVPASLADPLRTFALMIVVDIPTYSTTFRILAAAPVPSPSSSSPLTSAGLATSTSTVLTQATSITVLPTTNTELPTSTAGPIATPSQTSTPHESSGSLLTGALVGIIVGVLVVLAVIVYIIWRRRRQQHVNKISSPGVGGEETGQDTDAPELEGELKGDLTIPYGEQEAMEEKGGNPFLGSLQQQQQQHSPSPDDQRTTEDRIRKQQREEEIRRQIQQLQLQLEQSQEEEHHSLEAYTPAPFAPSMAERRNLYGNPLDIQGQQLRENLQLSDHPRPNVVTIVEKN